MSTAYDEQDELGTEAPGRLRWALRALALVAALVSLFTLWTGERVRVAHDLQLAVSPFASPGDVLAARAFVLRDVEAPSGPTLARVPVELRLLDVQGRELAHTRLAPTPIDSMEGTIRVPDTVGGVLTLEARATLAGEPALVCRRELEVSRDGRTLWLEGREAGPLQHFSLGPTRTFSGHAAPTPMLPRVVGGACVPEERCRLLVWVGEPAAAIALRAGGGAEIVGEPVPREETSGLVELTVVVHGMEADVTLEARRGGELVAERSLRLPVALGEVGIRLAKTLLEASEPVAFTLTAPPGRKHVIVDLFAKQQWAATRTYADVDPNRTLTLDASPLGTGLVRLSARTDPFTGRGSGGRALYVRPPGESDAEALRNMVSLATREAPGEETGAWASSIPAAVAQDRQRAAAFVLAPLEQAHVGVPLALSGRPAQLARVERAKTFVRFGVSAVLVLAGLVVGVSLMQRGLRASDEASSILAEAASEAHETVPAPRFERLRVIALVLAVCLAFVAGALAIAAKPLWF